MATRDDRHIVGFLDDTESERRTQCERARVLISARADGRDEATGAAWLDAHLTVCDDCVAHVDDVAALARMTRVRTVAADHSFVDRVMATARPVRLGRGGWMRPALAWCALVVMVQSIGPLVLGEVDGAPTHVARHVGASTLALGIGLLVVAWRPERAAGLLPFVAALFGAMLAGAVFDMSSGQRSLVSEALHVVELVGMTLLWLIAGSPGWDRVERVWRLVSRRRAVVRSTS